MQWIIHHLSRCISHWTWWIFQPAMLFHQSVVAMNSKRGRGARMCFFSREQEPGKSNTTSRFLSELYNRNTSRCLFFCLLGFCFRIWDDYFLSRAWDLKTSGNLNEAVLVNQSVWWNVTKVLNVAQMKKTSPSRSKSSWHFCSLLKLTACLPLKINVWKIRFWA